MEIQLITPIATISFRKLTTSRLKTIKHQTILLLPAQTTARDQDHLDPHIPAHFNLKIRRQAIH
jgi:hypothetical protein